jgi:uncharacterized membrane protein YcaP (DUF421 family)
MWHAIFHMGPSIGEKVIRTVLVYVFLIIALRLAGKRELGQLNSLDFVVLLCVANAVANGLVGDDNSVTGGIVGAIALFVLNAGVAVFLFRHARVRRALEGSPTELVVNGEVRTKALRDEKLTVDDVIQAVEEVGGRSFEEVETCILEPNGHIVTLLKTPDQETLHYMDLSRQLAELKALVERLTPAAG